LPGLLKYILFLSLFAEKGQKSQDQYNHSTSEVVKERDQLQADLTAVETAFSDLHRRYEKLKGVVENFKKNEETLKKATSDYQEKLKRSEEKYRLLKKHAEEKIERLVCFMLLVLFCAHHRNSSTSFCLRRSGSLSRPISLRDAF
ncbi:PREDICTED: transforming acidic coiled-coil-containing protein 1-like, partial [Acropora digitifera]|uniref:transforming acidic coiled-coil-containing protein 1-like n=1 Tax=Acropora digitifera TaxID=70779 RepID=UPI00077B0407